METGQYSDLTFTLGTKKWTVHKVLVCPHSKVIRDLVAGGAVRILHPFHPTSLPRPPNLIHINDISRVIRTTLIPVLLKTLLMPILYIE